MKLMEIKTYTSKRLFLRQYKVRCWNNIMKFRGTEPLEEILKEYTLEDLGDAVTSIYISNNYITIPEGGRYSKILRLLQFGGPRVRALNILSRTQQEIEGGLK